MINIHGNYWKPSDGYQYITNGEIYTDSIYLGVTDRIENWHDTNEQPPDEPDEETQEASLTRYANELTGASDITLTEATETLIKIIKENK